MAKGKGLIWRLISDPAEFEKGMNQANKAAEEGSNKIISTFGGIAKGLGVAGVAGAVALGGALAKGTVDAINQEATTDKMAAALLLSPEDAEIAAKAATATYTSAWGESYAQVASAQESVLRNLGSVGELGQAGLESATQHVLDLATAFDVDLNEAALTAGNLVKNGLVPDMEAAFDVLASGLSSSANGTGMLLETLNEFAEPLASLGIDGASALGAFSAAADAGVYDLTKVGDAFKELSIRAIDNSEASREAYKALGLDADQMAVAIAGGGPAAEQATSMIIQSLDGMSDKVAQDAAGVALFGSTWEDLGPTAIAALDPLANSIDGVDGSMQTLSDTLNDNLTVRMESLKRKGFQALADVAKVTVIPALEAIMPHLENFAAWAGDKLPIAVDYLKPKVEDAGVAVKAAFAAVGDWWDDNGDDVISGLEGLGEAAETAFGYVSDWWNDNGDTVIGGLEGVGGAVSTAFGWLVENKEVLLGALAGAATAIGVSLVGAFIAWTAAAIPAAAATIAATLPLIAVGVIIGGTVAAILYLWNNWDWFRINFTIGAIMVSEAVSGMVDWVQARFDDFQVGLDLLQKGWEVAWTLIKYYVGAARDWIGDKINSVRNFLTDVGTSLGNLVLKFQTGWATIRDFFTNVKSKATEMKDDVIAAFTSIPTKISEKGQEMFDKAKEFGKKMIDGVKSGFNTVLSLPGNLVDGLKTTLKNAANGVIDKINTAIPDKIGIPGLPDIDLPDNPIPHISSFIHGGYVAEQGIIRISETGTGEETLLVPGGTRVKNNRESEGSGNTYNNDFNIYSNDPDYVSRSIIRDLELMGGAS